MNFDKIKSLVYTEKSNYLMNNSKYSFNVCDSCNKSEISSIIKKIFDVNVVRVNILNTSNKNKRFKGRDSIKFGYKKAIVTLEKGQSINFSS